jgi:thiosulfate/3-mercaptopyruvate sulfurtransferase
MKSFHNLSNCFVPGLLVLMLCAALAQPLLADGIPPDPQIPSKQLISPEELNQMLKTQKPLLLQIGPHSLYVQAHIPGSEYIGGTSTPEGLNVLKARVKSEPKNKLIVLYCGCCPWNHCPNVHPGYKELRDLGYTNVRVLYMASNFGVDWVSKGYPTTRG